MKSHLAFLVVALALLSGPAVADDDGVVGPQEFSDLAGARSQIYEGFVGVIEGLQDGGNISGWATEMIEAAFGIAQGTVETIVFATTFSIPVGGIEIVFFIKDAWGQANTFIGLYDDFSYLMNNWSDGFIAGDQVLIWKNGSVGFAGKPSKLKTRLATLQQLTASESQLWDEVALDVMKLNDVDELLAQEIAEVEQALGPATYMYNTAQMWKDSGSVPNTFVCQFGEYSACLKLIDANHSITKAIYEFLLSEQEYLAGFMVALAEVELECIPGDLQELGACGECGNETLVCTEDGQWSEMSVCSDPCETPQQDVLEETSAPDVSTAQDLFLPEDIPSTVPDVLSELAVEPEAKADLPWGEDGAAAEGDTPGSDTEYLEEDSGGKDMAKLGDLVLAPDASATEGPEPADTGSGKDGCTVSTGLFVCQDLVNPLYLLAGLMLALVGCRKRRRFNH